MNATTTNFATVNDALNRVRPVCWRDKERPALRNPAIISIAGVPTAVGTDTHRLHAVPLPSDVTPCYPAGYPEVERVIPVLDDRVCIVVSAAPLIAALNALKVPAKAAAGGRVRLTIEDFRLTLTLHCGEDTTIWRVAVPGPKNSGELGDSATSCRPCSAVRLALNVRYLLDAVEFVADRDARARPYGAIALWAMADGGPHTRPVVIESNAAAESEIPPLHADRVAPYAVVMPMHYGE